MTGFALMVKPVSKRCDLRCKGCFYDEADVRFEDMTQATYELLVRHYHTSLEGEPPLYVWSGGEPTLWGLANFLKAYQTQLLHHRETANVLQTHGLHLDAPWVEFLRRARFEVGISIDGPHSLTRKWTENLHVHYRQVTGRLRKAGVPLLVLCVVDTGILEHARETLGYLRTFGATIQFIPKQLREPGQADPTVPSGDQLAGFWSQIIPMAIGGGIDLANVDMHAAAWVGEPTACPLMPSCPSTIIAEAGGDLYPCDFLVRPEWKLGNLWEMPVDVPMGKTIQGGQRYAAFSHMKVTEHQDCEECQLRPSCHRGCPARRFMVEGDFRTKDPQCAASKVLATATRPHRQPISHEDHQA